MDESDDLIVVVNEKDNDPIINIYNDEAVKKVKTMSSLVKNPKVVKEMKPKAVKTLFHTVATTITKMVDGIIDMNTNIVHLYDLAKNLVITTLEIRQINRLRYLLGEIRYLDEEEYKLNIDEYLLMIKNAGRIYKKITQNEIKNNEFNSESFDYDYYEERGIHYRKWTNNDKSYEKLQMHLKLSGIQNNTISSDLSTCISDEQTIIFITIIIPNDTYELIKDEIDINQTNTIAFDSNSGEDFDLTKCTNITTYFSFNEEDVNLENINFIKKKILIFIKNMKKLFKKVVILVKTLIMI